MIKLSTVPLRHVNTPKKIFISQTDDKNIIEIKNINDVDIMLFTENFFEKMQIPFIDIEVKYNYYLSQKDIVLKNEDSLQVEKIQLYSDKSIPFIKKRRTLIEYIWDKINSAFKNSNTQTQRPENENFNDIVLTNKLDAHPNPEYNYSIVISYDKRPDEYLVSFTAYLDAIRNEEVTIDQYLPSKLTYYEIGNIIYDIHQQLLYLKEMGILIIEIAFEDVYIIQGKFTIINTQRMTQVYPPDGSDIGEITLNKNIRDGLNVQAICSNKKYADVMLKFIKQLVLKENDVFMKEIEHSYLHKYMLRLSQGMFQI